MSNHKHGHSRNGAESPTYNSWKAMGARCTNPNAPNYSYYGGRGITVCDRWRDFSNFLAGINRQTVYNRAASPRFPTWEIEVRREVK